MQDDKSQILSSKQIQNLKFKYQNIEERRGVVEFSIMKIKTGDVSRYK
jgi:hypothetical protein